MGVPVSDILTNNNSLSTTNPTDPIAVFVGGTAGIGLGSLQALIKHTAKPTVYIVGRSLSKLDTLIAELKKSNENAVLIPISASDLTLVHDAQHAAAEIARQVERVDLLIMSPGYVTFTGREEHATEGIDKVTAVRYYSRMAFVLGLKDKLQAAPAPRVVSVLAGGSEGSLWKEDLLLREEGHYGVGITGSASAGAAGMTTLFFENISNEIGWEKAVFAHIFPGLVNTKLEFRGLGVVGDLLLKWIGQPIIRLVGYSLQEAGERVLFVGTSERFRRLKNGVEEQGSLVNKGSDGRVGSGVYLVQGDTGIVPPSKESVKSREEGMGKIVYEHTLEVLGKVEKGLRA